MLCKTLARVFIKRIPPSSPRCLATEAKAQAVYTVRLLRPAGQVNIRLTDQNRKSDLRRVCESNEFVSAVRSLGYRGALKSVIRVKKGSTSMSLKQAYNEKVVTTVTLPEHTLQESTLKRQAVMLRAAIHNRVIREQKMEKAISGIYRMLHREKSERLKLEYVVDFAAQPALQVAWRTLTDIILAKLGWGGSNRQKFVETNLANLVTLLKLQESQVLQLFSKKTFSKFSVAAHSVKLDLLARIIDNEKSDVWGQASITRTEAHALFLAAAGITPSQYKKTKKNLTLTIIKKNHKVLIKEEEY